jgi:SOS regulatory protein LexA
MLTKRQKQVLDFIKSFRDKKGYAPSLEEIKRHLHLSSVSTVHHHVRSLEESGYLKKQENLPRSIDVYETQSMVQIPILGRISAGQPILAVEDREIISVPRTNIRGDIRNLYALKVVGQSMIEENINNGDIVVVHSQSTAEDGQKIVALINNEEVTLKKIYLEKKQIRLQPANSNYPPIIVDPENLVIQGLVIDVIKYAESEDKIYEQDTHKQQPVSLKKLNDFVNQVIEGDCLEVMRHIPNKSIDMVLCDLPYGTTQNQWDSVIPLDKLWKHYERIIKDNGVIALTAQGLFSAKLMLSNPKLFKYKIIWVKSKPTNFLNAKKQPLRKHEDILIFYKQQPNYSPQMAKGEPYNKGFRKDQLTGSYGDFRTVEVKSNGERYPTDVVYFKTAESEGPVYHPTQKPVELGRYLIKTFTNLGDIVLDNTCGSGSFLVSAIFEGRKFIGIEKNKEVYLFKKKRVDYIEVCKQRIKEAEEQYAVESNRLKLF